MACETCIMETRISNIETYTREQSSQYTSAQIEAAGRMAKMETNIETISQLTKDINKKLDSVLDKNRENEIAQAASKNEIPASKWKSLSAGTKAVIVTIIGSTSMLIIGYIFTLITK